MTNIIALKIDFVKLPEEICLEKTQIVLVKLFKKSKFFRNLPRNIEILLPGPTTSPQISNQIDAATRDCCGAGTERNGAPYLFTK